MSSISVKIGPQDSRCRYWAKIIKAEDLPIPSSIDGANDIPGPYKRHGDEELLVGEFLIEGEEIHHRKARGWAYNITFLHNGNERTIKPSSEIKQQMKAAGMPPELLKGSGDIAACVRIAIGARDGYLK